MGYYDNWGIWHDHTPAQFCQFHPTDFMCINNFTDLGMNPTQSAIPNQPLPMSVSNTGAYTETKSKSDWEYLAKDAVNLIGEQIGWIPLLLVILLGLNKTVRQKAINIIKALK